MAAPLKTAGLRELAALRKRAKRQLALERVAAEDVGFIVKRLDEIEARIIEMREEGADDGD
jgi:hypothetical protein